MSTAAPAPAAAPLPHQERPVARTPAQQRRRRIALPTGCTPLVELRLLIGGTERTLRLKLEAYNPCGSIKDRTAQALLDAVAADVDPGLGVIESTSGNLGVALAALCASRGIPFTGVVDPRTSDLLLRRMRRLGAVVVVVDEPDASGGFLLSRLRYVARELQRRPGLVWTDQYANEANPQAHQEGTATELWWQLGSGTTVFIAVSTGGTFAGFQRFVAAHQVPWRLRPVDVAGSVALGGAPGPRPLPGIGSSRAATFVAAGATPAYVTAAEAVAACLWLLDSTGVDVGASSGAAVAAALAQLREDPSLRDATCICPDGGDRYVATVYAPSWRARHGIAPVDVARDVVLLGTDPGAVCPLAARPSA